MQLHLLAVGKRLPAWIDAAVEDYTRRLPRTLGFRLIELSPARRTKNGHAGHYRQQERARIEAALTVGGLVIVFDETGKTISSRGLAAELQGWQARNCSISLIIGGADGLCADLKDRADAVWSLSKMTLPHGLARVLVVEQLYRATSINRRHPYHREVPPKSMTQVIDFEAR